MTVKAIADTGVANQTLTALPITPSDKALELIRLARTIVINEETRTKLGLLDSGVGEATFADGQKGEYPMAGPIEIWWEKRRFTCDALVLPDAPDTLLGAVPLEVMDLIVDPSKQELIRAHGDEVVLEV
jgi:hypothetical protein